MEQVNSFALFLLGKWLDSIFLHAKLPLNTNVGAWHQSRAMLDILITGDAKLKLNESAAAARSLKALIEQVLEIHASNPEAVLTELQVGNFNSAWLSFEQALALDLGRAPVYFVTPKGIYATPSLINSAEAALVDEVAGIISDAAKRDLNQAGRCLAFNLSTAAGYHALRATEKVLREYYTFVLHKPAEQVRMKQAIDELIKAKAEPKTLAVIDQLRSLHRNPIDHPEVFLEPAEAMELFSICTSAISAMARQMKIPSV